MKMKSANAEAGTARPSADIPADRTCLKCRTSFRSKGFGERICSRCKESVAWRSAATGVVGTGHRRSGIQL